MSEQTASPTEEERATGCAICKGTGVVRQELDPGIWVEEPCGHGWAERTLARHAEEQRRIRERFDSGAPSTFEDARAADNGGNWISRRAFEEVDRLRAEIGRLTAPASEDEQTTAERWARTHYDAAYAALGCPYLGWGEMSEREREAEIAATLPLVREARAKAARWEGLAELSATAIDRLRAEQASRPAPLTEAPSRELVEALYQLRATLSTREQRDRMRAVTAIVHASWLTLAAPPSRGDIPADVRPSGCSDGCGAAKDAHCWNTSSWTLAAKEDLVAALADPATAEGAAALLDIGAYQGGKLDIDERARQTEPALTTAEQDLVVAAIPLQTGLTRDGQRLAADGIRQALERPPLTEADVTEIARAALSAWGASKFRTLGSCIGSAILAFEAREGRSGRGDIQADVDTKGAE